MQPFDLQISQFPCHKLKETRTFNLSRYYGQNTSPYSQTIGIDIFRYNSNLKMMFIKSVITNGSNANNNVYQYFTARIFSSIILKTKTGKATLARYTPQYLETLYDEYQGSPNYVFLSNCCASKNMVANTPYTFYTPLILPFVIPVETIEDLELELITASSAAKMQLANDIASINVSLKCIYYSDVRGDVNIPKSFASPFPFFEQIFPLSLTANQSVPDQKIQLTCPFSFFAIHVYVEGPKGGNDLIAISSFQLLYGGQTIVDLDASINFDLDGIPKSTSSPSYYLSYWLSEEKDRKKVLENSSTVSMTKGNEPLQLLLEFASTPANTGTYNIIIICDYIRQLDLTKNGELADNTITVFQYNSV